MNRTILIAFLIIFNWTCFSQTQHQLRTEASEEYENADVELNNVYKEILDQYKSDSIFIDRLENAQKIWISHRDAELEMRFPAKNKQLEYGSAYPMCVSQFLEKLTEERTEQLKVWLNGIEEGEMCSGSVKTN